MNTKTSTQIRYEVLRTVEALSREKGSGPHNIYPAQIDNSTYTELGVHLQILTDKGLLKYTPRPLKRVYQIELLPPGEQLVHGFMDAFLNQDEVRLTEFSRQLK